MSTETRCLEVGGLRVEVVRKDIRNLHVGVYPPAGRVRVAAPLAVSDDAVRLAVVGRLGWIRRQQARFQAQPRQSAREMVHGESHYYLGQRYRLVLAETSGRPRVSLQGATHLLLHARPGAAAPARWQVLEGWYRRQVHELLAPMIAHWAAAIGVAPPPWRVRWMKTKWGSCNPRAPRLWFNLALVRVPVECIEYVVVHELLHLIEPSHSPAFIDALTRHMPDWNRRRTRLNAQPLTTARQADARAPRILAPR
jgi:predicted metal-dependent hydrolase